MKIIITGSTGMVGKGVLLECLEDNSIESVLLINRRPIDIKHDKIIEIIHKDFSDLSAIKDQLKGYDACFHCMGVSVLGLDEEKYSHLTFDITKAFADTLYELNPQAVFNYVSGTGTDSSEKGRVMWARVKGKAENYLFSKGFKDAYAFRPGFILPMKGVKSSTGWYNAIYVILSPFFGLMKNSKSITTSEKIGRAMINSLTSSMDLKHLENKDINQLSGI